MQDPHPEGTQSQYAPTSVSSDAPPALQPETDAPATERNRRADLRAIRDAISPDLSAIGGASGDSAPERPRTGRGRKPAAAPSIFRDAARALITPKNGPKPGDKIAFERDDTRAVADRLLGMHGNSAAPVKRGPLPRTAPAEAQQRRDKAREIREQISPLVQSQAVSAEKPAAVPASPQLSDAEMEQVISWTVQRFGPILNISQAAELSKLAKQTIHQRVSEGRYADCVVRGRPLRFWTHRFVRAAMQETAS